VTGSWLAWTVADCPAEEAFIASNNRTDER